MVHYQSGAGPGSFEPYACSVLAICACLCVEELAERSEEAQDANLLPVVMAFDTLRTRHLQAVGMGRGLWACGQVGGLKCLTKTPAVMLALIHDTPDSRLRVLHACAPQVFRDICNAMSRRHPDFVTRYMYGGARQNGKAKKHSKRPKAQG